MSYVTGKHPARAIAAALGMAETGSYQVGVEFLFTDGPNKDSTITWYGYFTEKTKERTIESLKIAGLKGVDISDLSSLSASDTPTVQIVLEEEEYQGNRQVKVKWVNKIGGLAMKNQLDESGAKQFAALMRGDLAAYDAEHGGGAKPAPKPNGAKPASDTSDVPF